MQGRAIRADDNTRLTGGNKTPGKGVDGVKPLERKNATVPKFPNDDSSARAC